MPHKCCVPNCKGNYKNGPKVHVFGFPKDQSLREKWISLIPRDNFVLTKFTKVCHLHFSEKDIIRKVTQQDSRTGETVTAYLDYPRLKHDAIPSRFGDNPESESDSDSITVPTDPNELVTVPTDPEESITLEPVRQIKEEEIVDISDLQIKTEIPSYRKITCYDNFNDFLTVLSTYEPPKYWFAIKEGRRVIIFKLLYDPGPITSYSVVISYDLTLRTYLYGQEIIVSIENVETPFKSSNLDQISALLELIDKKEAASNFNDNEQSKCILNHVISLLATVKDNENGHLAVISEQLRLHMRPKERYRHLTKILIFASIMFRISAPAYEFLRDSGFLILPTPRAYNKFFTDSTCEEKDLVPRNYRNLLKLLTDTERHVVLSINEIDTKPYFHFRSNFTTAYAFVISSIYSNFREVVHILPPSKINQEKLHDFIKTIITDLEEIGYRVFCVVSNVNPVNGKAMSKFAVNNKLSIVYPHPVSNSRPLFFLYDPIHLLKCIKYDWLNSKSNQILSYPDFETGTEKFASFQSIKTLYDLEREKQIKLDSSLSLKELVDPSPTQDLHDASLVQKMFHPVVVQGLLKVQQYVDKSRDTADFIDIILRWKNMLNDNILKGDSRLTFLEKMLNWLDIWKEGKFSYRLSSHTHVSLYHTIHGMLEITKYCFEELKLNYVLFNKFQTDSLEHVFGKYRRLDNNQYFSIRKLYKIEKRLIIHKLLSLKSPSFGNIAVAKYYENIDELDEEPPDNSFKPTVSITENDVEEVKNEIAVITYLASYCCYAALKEQLKCEFCKQKLVYPEELVVENLYNLVENIKKGDLLFPHDVVVQIVLCTYIVFNNLLQNFEEELDPIRNKRRLIFQLVLEYVADEGYLMHFKGCENHNEENTAKIIITWITNTFLKNYYGKSRLKKRKRRKIT